jgi:hypothetical protein
MDIEAGDGGGDGVVDVERNVGPRGVVAVDIGESRVKLRVRSAGSETGRPRDLRGCG